MKKIRFIKISFLVRNELVLLVLVLSLLLMLSGAGYAQQEIRAIRHNVATGFNIDPCVALGWTSSIGILNLYDSLVFPDPEQDVRPSLAKSWEISEDGRTFTFELVPGVKFHNGDELTSEDVVFSMERYLTIGEGYGYLYTENVKEAKVLDKYKFQITLKRDFGPFLASLVRFYILNKNQIMANIKEGPYGEFGDYGKNWLVTNDAGSGPYLVKEIRTEEHLLLEKFNDYWAGWENENAPDYVKMIGTTEPITIRTLMSRGELELTDPWQSKEALASLDQLPGVEIATLLIGCPLEIMFNTKKPPSDDIHFRKALGYCVDYDQVVNKILPGSPRSVVVPPDTPAFNPNLEPYEFDLAKAEEELKKSPYYGKLDQYPFELHYDAYCPDREKIALMLQANAAKIGINIEVVKSSFVIFANVMAQIETTPTSLIMGVCPHYAEAGSLLSSRYHSSACGTWEQGEWLQDPEIDAMIEDALATLDKEERFQKYYDIQEKLYELFPTIWLVSEAAMQAYRSDYIVDPAVEAKKQGKPSNIVMGYNYYYRDFKVTPEKAQPPYTPFKP